MNRDRATAPARDAGVFPDAAAVDVRVVLATGLRRRLSPISYDCSRGQRTSRAAIRPAHVHGVDRVSAALAVAVRATEGAPFELGAGCRGWYWSHLSLQRLGHGDKRRVSQRDWSSVRSVAMISPARASVRETKLKAEVRIPKASEGA